MSVARSIEARAAELLADRHERVDLARAEEVEVLPIDWLWEGWVARGKLHLLAGDAGTGKTTIALSLAAALSAGSHWPDGSCASVGTALVWSGEDDPADTIVPRLMAAGADLARIYVVRSVTKADSSRPFDPAEDLELLRRRVGELGQIDLLVVDPVVSAVAGDSHKNTEVRRSLQPLVDLAADLRCAVLGISHFSKGGSGIDPLLRVTGSVAFGAMARVVLVAAKLRGADERIFARAKSNIGPDDGGFAYQIAMSDGPISASRIAWGEPLEGAARDLVAEDDPSSQSAAELARDWLQRILVDGPVESARIRTLAQADGVSMRTLERVKKQLSVVARRDGEDGSWRWHGS